MDQYSRRVAKWVAAAVVTICAVGCGGPEYQKRIQRGVQALRAAAEADGFSASQQLAGTNVWVRVPEQFQLLTASPTLAYADSRLKLAEVDLSGKIFTFESLVDYPEETAEEPPPSADASPPGASQQNTPPSAPREKTLAPQASRKDKVACYLYFAVEDLAATRNRDPIEWFRQKVGLRYGSAELRETEVRAPQGRLVSWWKLSLGQVQAFYFQAASGREEVRPMQGVIEVFLRHDPKANLLIAAGWRVPKVLEGRLQAGKYVGLTRLAERTLGLVEVRH
jgi:hypothetical protein